VHKTTLLVLALLLSCRHESDLPKLFPVPNVNLVNEQGRPVALEAMKGYVTVYDFIFTNCAGTCPMMTANMRRLTRKIDVEAPVRFVSISVDPARDTPAVLSEYAKKVRNDDRWIFLTGDGDAIIKLSVEGFKLAAGGPTNDGAEPLLHSSKFAIADKEGVIRHYYGGTDGDASEAVAKVIEDLLVE
jgi:cytochrome oxidase Cu insertion factor (SCO1/SenC/PrrC family)